MGSSSQKWLQRLQYLSGLQWALGLIISWQLCLLIPGWSKLHLVWSGLLERAEAVEHEGNRVHLSDVVNYCPQKSTFFILSLRHSMTFILQCNPSVCLCGRIYLLFQLFSPCMVFSGEDNISSMAVNSSKQVCQGSILWCMQWWSKL